jgi:hypothetical protein
VHYTKTYGLDKALAFWKTFETAAADSWKRKFYNLTDRVIFSRISNSEWLSRQCASIIPPQIGESQTEEPSINVNDLANPNLASWRYPLKVSSE